MKRRILLSAVSVLLAVFILTGCTLDTSFFGYKINIDININERDADGGQTDFPAIEHSPIDYDENELGEVTVNGAYTQPFDEPDTLTNDDILTFADMYDRDAYSILEKRVADDPDADLIKYYHADDDIVAEFDTTVHENCHFTNKDFRRNDECYFDIYVGDGEWVTIKANESDIFTSDELVDFIDEEYRTFRYDTYIDAESNMGSVMNGCFGLLDEFSAYCWGTKAALGTYNYLKNSDPASDGIHTFITSYANRGSYAEFDFYILSYLLYAKENYPEKYESIMGNSDFLYAFNKIECEFRKVLNTFGMKINEYAEANDNVSISDDGRFCISESSHTTYYPFKNEEYDLLMEKLSTPEYAEMRELMKNY